MADFATLELFDGTTTIDLLDGDNYALQQNGWAPAETFLRTDRMAGRSPYAEVDEQITINIHNESSAAQTLARRRAISLMLDQAARWTRRADVPPVIFRVKPQGSTQPNPLEAVVRAGGEPSVRNPATWSDLLPDYSLDGVRLEFTRDGLLLAPPESVSGSAALTTPVSLTFPGNNRVIPSPLKLAMTNYRRSQSGFLITHPDPAKIAVREAEAAGTSISPGGSAVSVNQADARGGKVMRLHAGSGVLFTWSLSPDWPTALLGQRCHRFVSLRTENVPWRVWAGDGVNQTRPRIVSFAQPTLLYLGISRDIRVFVEAVGSTNINHYCFIDYIAAAASDAAVLALPPNGLIPASSVEELRIDPRPLTHPDPQVALWTGSIDTDIPRRGDAYLTQRGTSVGAVMLATDRTYWQPRNAGDSGLLATNTWTATRWPSYLTPE